jgi:tetratricopeptide (TPR) repeat protein
MAAYLPQINFLFELARYADAAPLLREALARNPNDALAHAMLGVALSRTGPYRPALDESEAAISLDPTEPYVFYARCLVLIRGGHIPAALVAIHEAIRLNNHHAEYFLILGAMLFDKQQWNRALEAFDRALAVEPRNVRCLNLRSRTLLKLGRRGEAEQTMNTAVEVAPEDADAHHAQGVMLLTRAQTDEALDHLLEARRLNPVTRNDSDSIALAVGWRLIPFRWINRRAVHWDLWPPRAIWALFCLLMFAQVALRMWVPFPVYRGRHVYSELFGVIALNAILAPFTLDALARVAARIARRRLVGSTWQKVSGQMLILGSSLMLHVLATGLGSIAPLVMLVFALCCCKDFTAYAIHCWVEKRLGHIGFTLYSVPLAVLIIAMMAQVNVPPYSCLLTLALFGLIALFSDNVLLWIKSRDF